MGIATLKMVSLLATPYIYFEDTLLMSFGHSQLLCRSVEIQECNICTPLWDILYVYIYSYMNYKFSHNKIRQS